MPYNEAVYTEEDDWFSNYYEPDDMSILVEKAADVEDKEERNKMILDYVEERIQLAIKEKDAKKKKTKEVPYDEKLYKLLVENFDAYRLTGRKFPEKAIKYAKIHMNSKKLTDEK